MHNEQTSPSAIAVNPYCSHCGHALGHPHNHNRSFWEEAVELGFHFDFRHFRSLPLLFVPGFLAKRHCGSERGRYSPPLKIYVFVSLLFIGLFWARSHAGLATVSGLQNSHVQVEQKSGKINPDRDFGLFTQDEGSVVFLGDFGKWLGINGMKLEFDSQHLPANLQKSVFFGIFLVVPLLSIMLMLIYLRHPVGFWDHMTFVLYAQAAVFVVLIHSALMEYFGWGRFVWGTANLTMAYIVFLYASQKSFYGQNWQKTLVKFSILFVAYFFSFSILFALSMVVGFLMSFHKA